MHSQWASVAWITELQRAVNSMPAVVLKLPLLLSLLVVGSSAYIFGLVGAWINDDSISTTKNTK
jgi:hypothetical protein